MKQYEFMTVPMTSANLIEHGLAGWALKAVHAGLLFLEREIEPPAPEPVAAEPAPVTAPEPAPAEAPVAAPAEEPEHAVDAA